MKERKQINKDYYERNKIKLRKQRNEKYKKNRDCFILKVNEKFFKASLNPQKFLLTDNYLESRFFYSNHAIQKIIKKYNFKETEVKIINV